MDRSVSEYVGDYSPFAAFSAGDVVSSGGELWRAIGAVAPEYAPASYDLGSYGSGSTATMTPSHPVGIVSGDRALVVHWRTPTSSTHFTYGGVAQVPVAAITTGSYVQYVFAITVDTSKTLSFTTSAYGAAVMHFVGKEAIQKISTYQSGSATSGAVANNYDAVGSSLAVALAGGASSATFTLTGGALSTAIVGGAVKFGITLGTENFTATVIRTNGSIGWAGLFIELADPDLSAHSSWEPYPQIEPRRFLKVGGSPVAIGGDPTTPPIIIVSETHLNQAGTHTHSISGLQAGDLMLAITAGPYRVATPPAGWTMIADTGTGAFAMSETAMAAFAEGPTASVTFTFAASNAANFTSIIVFRNAVYAMARAAQTYSAVNSTAVLNFPVLPPTGPGVSGHSAPTLALVCVSGATSGITYTISPTPTEVLLDYDGVDGRQHFFYLVPPSSSYSATPSASDYKAGLVIHLG